MPQIRYSLLIVINLWSVQATKYCSYELNGDPKYFVCARNEYCCNLGCCVHLAFQFYQLWYYWLLLIFMFMICSGGSWWYKFCRQNESTSHYPSVPLTIDRAGRHNFPELHGRRAAARAFDRSHANEPSSYHFHRIWKANNIAASPNYYTAPIVRYHNGDVDSRRSQHHECPYYQLYGPPPSYESVVQISDSSHNGQASCMLLPSTNAVPLPQPMITAALQASSSNPAQLEESVVTSTVTTLASSSQPIATSMTKQPAETAPVLSDSSADSSPSKSHAASPTAPQQNAAEAPRQHSLHNQSSKPSTSDPSQHHHLDQTQKELQYSFHHHKNYRRSHHLLHHPTIHSIGVNVQETGGRPPSYTYRNASKSTTASSPPSASASSSTEQHHQPPSTDGTTAVPNIGQASLSSSLPLSTSALSQAQSSVVHSVTTAATKLTLSSPIEENGTRV